MKMTNAMQILGHEVELIVPNRSRDIELGVNNIFDFYNVDPIKIKYMPWFKFPGILYIYSFMTACYVKFRGVKFVYSRDFYPALFCAFFGIDVIMEFHRKPIFAKGIKGEIILKFYKLSNLKGIVVISQALKDIFVKSGFNEDKIKVAHDASDAPLENQTPYPLEGEVKVGYVGHLYKGRGIENIIYLAERNAHLNFHIAGGTDRDISYWKSKCTDLINLHFHGFIPPSLTDSFRNSCDVLLAPYQKGLTIWAGGSDTSSFMSPLKIFEYMAAGKVIICSDLPVLREVLNDQNALLVTPTQMEEWNSALRRAISNKKLANELSVRAKMDFKKKYSWKARAHEITSLFSL